MEIDICPLCEKTKLISKTFSDTYNLVPTEPTSEQIIVHNLKGLYCMECKEYIISRDHIEHNHTMISDFRKAASNEIT